MSALEKEVLRLPKLQKISMMEKIWEDLSKGRQGLYLTEWHEQELEKTQQLIDTGEAKFLDWEEAKRQIREA